MSVPRCASHAADCLIEPNIRCANGFDADPVMISNHRLLAAKCCEQDVCDLFMKPFADRFNLGNDLFDGYDFFRLDPKLIADTNAVVRTVGEEVCCVDVHLKYLSLSPGLTG